MVLSIRFWSLFVWSANNPANTKHLYTICTMSAQSLRRRPDIVQMLYKCFVFAGCRPNVFDVGPTLYKCYTNVLCLLGCVQRLWLVLQSLMFRVDDHIVEAEWSMTYLGQWDICRSAIPRCMGGCLKAVHESLWTNIVFSAGTTA